MTSRLATAAEAFRISSKWAFPVAGHLYDSDLSVLAEMLGDLFLIQYLSSRNYGLLSAHQGLIQIRGRTQQFEATLTTSFPGYRSKKYFF